MNERELFLAALEIDDPAERQAFLQDACADNAELLQQVESLLASHDAKSKFLETPVVEQVGGSSSETGETLLVDRAALREDEAEGDAAREWLAGFLATSDQADSLGRLGHYEIQEVIGSGAFGTVLKAFDEKLQRVVAIKVMSPEMAATSPARKRFLREARSSAAVRHDNVVSIYAVEDEPIPFLVMEYIPGQTLQQRLDGNGPLDLSEVVKLGGQLADGLAAAHAKDLIHRDIKPGNILLDTSVGDHVKITDFGLARTADDASLTQSGLIAGTPMYMAPEQARGETLDHRADLFSLGSVLYQMVSGRPPFRASNAVAVLKRVCEDTPRAIQEVIPETPDWLCLIIFRLLEKDRGDRFQSAREVADVLRRCAVELAESGAVTSVSIALPSRERVGETVPAGKSTDRQSNRRILIVVVAMLAAFVLVQGVAPRLARWLDTPIPELSSAKQTGGLRFDGRDDWVEVPNLEWHYPQFTIEAFVTSKSGSDNGTIAFLSGGESGKREWMSLFDGGRAQPGKRISGIAAKGQTAYENAYGPFAGGQRQHRALVFDGKHLHYYINGVWQGERHAAPYEGLQWKMNELRLGSDGSGKQFFEGVIDLVRISRVARYDNNFPAVETLSSDDLTLALYNCDETSGTVLADASGNGHHGVVHGATWLQADESIDLIRLLEPERDFRDERLKIRDGKLITPQFVKPGAVGIIPYGPLPDSYDIQLQLQRLSNNFAGFNMGIVVGGHQVCVGMDCGYNEKTWGLDRLGENYAHQPENPTRNPGRRLIIGQTSDVTIQVRKNHVTASCDGEVVIDWTGDPEQLSVFELFDVPELDSLFFVAQADFIVHKMTLVPHGTASAKRPPVSGLVFDGVNDYVATPITYDGETPLTVEACVQISEWPDATKKRRGCEIVSDTDNGGFSLGMSAEGVHFSVKSGDRYVAASVPAADALLNRPVRLAGVLDDHTLRLFIDGQLSDEKLFEDPFKPSKEKISLGTSPGNGQPNDTLELEWAGRMFEVRLSDVARYESDYGLEDSLEADEHTIALYRIDKRHGFILDDSSANAHHGTIAGAKWGRARALQAAAGSYALSFDGPEDSVVVPGLRGKLDGGPVTIEAWVTMGPGELPDDQRISIFRDKNSMYAHLQLHKTWRFWRATTARGQGLVTSQPPQPSERTHVAAVWTGRRGMIFVNGHLAETKTAHVQGLTFDSNAPTWIGGLADTPIQQGSFVSYSIDELRISTIARYSEGFTPEDSYQPDEHTLALYHFDDGTGSVLKDSSGNGHHGSIDGAVWVGTGQ